MDNPSTPDRPGPAPSPAAPAPADAAATPSRYDANLRLIRRRLADEKRTTKDRRWWKSRP